MNKAIVLLEDGTIFYGKAEGPAMTSVGEICFTTGMTGYQEVFTDPSYFNQIVVATNTHIGNYGIHRDESQSGSVKIAGFVCRNFNEQHSRVRESESLPDFFRREGILAVSEVDTRKLVRHIREKGAMNALISSEDKPLEELKAILAKAPSMKGMGLASEVSTQKMYTLGDENRAYRIAVLDLGVKRNILDSLLKYDAYVGVFPHNASLEEIAAWKPDGILISNGPGDPEPLHEQAELVKKLIDQEMPTFGICLGHQLISLSQGLETFKMFNGHRGINHPVKNLLTGRCEVTSQNHGFAVSRESAEKNGSVEITHIHLNDDTIAGLRLRNKPVFSVQYHPEASPGPNDSEYLFEQFFELIRENKAKKPGGKVEESAER
ncbi:glutamine-hydrolyzing carbamoyl-phosphate synthase small subunit [Nafulsella turpanensis]|uniref:glutamine-hydrolyzing carbamoyl-phosphate synthase small subunit n=1 Tax=Nafulsella turpanensis TaxID=1265690 RepID=UPI000348831A|nr:glutamine-hydrolyzing carbamoyl-phosphate synthase small subunit [Nafulsella turpanensis]